ncbi:MAG: carbohydrate kinase family protein [Patescibacteria group bacterium]
MNTPQSNHIDILAIGDTVVDAFIKLKVAEVHTDEKTEQKVICMPFGDKVPFTEVTELAGVGNSANAAVSAARLGLQSALLTNVGADINGEKSIAKLTGDKVITDYILKNEGKKTNYHYVLWFQDERTILINHELYDYHIPEVLKAAQAPEYIYLSSLGENTLPFHTELTQYLTAHPDIKLVFQPGTFQIKFGVENLKEIYSRSYLFFCNKEEAVRILGLDKDADHGIRHLLLELRKLGPTLPVITDGPQGSYTFDVDMKNISENTITENTPILYLPIYPDPMPPLERTGAGDAFASTFTVAIVHGKDIRTALIWGSINSMSVCQDIGAQRGLLTEEKLTEWIEKAPETWKISTL